MRLARLCEVTALTHSIGRRVLEVGCSNGAMLQQWGSDWVKSGIEPSRASAKVANQRGINVVGAHIGDLKCGQWDCIVSVDTVEHIIDPMSFFRCAKDLLAPGGIIITLTGDMSFGLARCAGSRYWYASFPEHISFLVPATFSYIAGKLNGQVIFSRLYRWGSPGALDGVQFLLQSIKYIIMYLVLSASRSLGFKGVISRRGFPVMTAHCDHSLTVMGRFQ
ncbi:class I SAM-dependent methyltransferase [Cyanobium sp. BA5m-21]|nr:class I SAM-dependent methyltransferase [Cyanobium sp. BA5m-10]MCP9903248.1 class I SAM-dependent methyltransferase [Cyanobium sp. BA5m-10]MCP9907942.1 class I SAM-dependent methyltransferase [Cyanobium sp. BA5m-21]